MQHNINIERLSSTQYLSTHGLKKLTQLTLAFHTISQMNIHTIQYITFA